MKVGILIHVSGINEHWPFFMVYIANIFKAAPELIDINKASIIKELFISLIQISYRTRRIGAAPDKAAVRVEPDFIQIRKEITWFVFLDKLF